MAKKKVYPIVTMDAFDYIIANGGGIEFIVADNKDARIGFVYHVLAVTETGKKHLLVRNKGNESFPYEIKSEISKTKFAQKKRVQFSVVETPDLEKYPIIQ